MTDIHSAEWIAAANAELAAKPCKGCGEVGTAAVTREFAAKPIGSFSLAGQQMKTTGNFVIVYRCSSCTFAARLDLSTWSG